MEQKNYTLKECRAFNRKRFELTINLARDNFKNAECKELVLPDEAHPWNILRSVIEQFYNREYEIAQTIDEARYETDRVKKMIEDVKDRDSLYWSMQKEIGDLKQENERIKVELSLSEKRVQEQPKALQELLQEAHPTEWVHRIGKVLDVLVLSLEYIRTETVSVPLYNTRRLQQFFIELEKGAN